MKVPFSKLVVRYLVFVGIPYLVARQLEKYIMKRLSPELREVLNKELKKSPKKGPEKFPDIESVPESTRDVLGIRGGANPVVMLILKLMVEDFAVKAAIGGAIGSTVWSGTADNVAGTIAKYGAAIASAPGRKFMKFANKLRGIDSQYDSLKELLLDKDLTIADKLELFKIKLESTIKKLRGSKRKKFILFAIALLLFFTGGGILPVGNSATFAALMERLRALIGTDDIDEDIRDALIEVYQEYNAPLPAELIPQAIKDAIDGIQ